MKKAIWTAPLLALVVAGCGTVKPEYRMIPTAENGVGVRFSRGNAAMVSNGPTGSVMLLPVRYNSESKLYFAIAAFNRSGQPVNFGTEDVRIYVDGLEPVRVQDFNYLRQSKRVEAQRELNSAWIDAGIDGYLAQKAYPNATNSERLRIATRVMADSYAFSSAAIETRLQNAIATMGRQVLQTTTIDPGRTFGGWVLADQLVIPAEGRRAILVRANFGGYSHDFTINLASSDSADEVPTNIPAVPAQAMQRLQTTPQTWHWTQGPPPLPPGYGSIPVIQ